MNVENGFSIRFATSDDTDTARGARGQERSAGTSLGRAGANETVSLPLGISRRSMKFTRRPG
jgi:hypothetical protein